MTSPATACPLEDWSVDAIQSLVKRVDQVWQELFTASNRSKAAYKNLGSALTSLVPDISRLDQLLDSLLQDDSQFATADTGAFVLFKTAFKAICQSKLLSSAAKLNSRLYTLQPNTSSNNHKPDGADAVHVLAAAVVKFLHNTGRALAILDQLQEFPEWDTMLAELFEAVQQGLLDLVVKVLRQPPPTPNCTTQTTAATAGDLFFSLCGLFAQMQNTVKPKKWREVVLALRDGKWFDHACSLITRSDVSLPDTAHESLLVLLGTLCFEYNHIMSDDKANSNPSQHPVCRYVKRLLSHKTVEEVVHKLVTKLFKSDGLDSAVSQLRAFAPLSAKAKWQAHTLAGALQVVEMMCELSSTWRSCLTNFQQCLDLHRGLGFAGPWSHQDKTVEWLQALPAECQSTAADQLMRVLLDEIEEVPTVVSEGHAYANTSVLVTATAATANGTSASSDSADPKGAAETEANPSSPPPPVSAAVPSAELPASEVNSTSEIAQPSAAAITSSATSTTTESTSQSATASATSTTSIPAETATTTTFTPKVAVGTSDHTASPTPSSSATTIRASSQFALLGYGVARRPDPQFYTWIPLPAYHVLIQPADAVAVIFSLLHDLPEEYKQQLLQNHATRLMSISEPLFRSIPLHENFHRSCFNPPLWLVHLAPLPAFQSILQTPELLSAFEGTLITLRKFLIYWAERADSRDLTPQVTIEMTEALKACVLKSTFAVSGTMDIIAMYAGTISPSVGLAANRLSAVVKVIITGLAQQSPSLVTSGLPARLITAAQLVPTIGGTMQTVGCWYPGCTNLAGKYESELHLSTCRECGKARYCCRDCQKKDWQMHKALCKQNTKK